MHLNLTKYRLSLLNEARKLIENIEAIAKSIAAGSNDLRTVMIFFFESLDVLKSKISGYSNDSNEWICVVNGHWFDFKSCLCYYH